MGTRDPDHVARGYGGTQRLGAPDDRNSGFTRGGQFGMIPPDRGGIDDCPSASDMRR
jgi:hypothetical protein